MANLKELVDETSTKHPAKKATKSKLSFTTKAVSTKETIADGIGKETISTVITSAKKIDVPVKKEPNLDKGLVAEVADVIATPIEAVNTKLPVEEVVTKTAPKSVAVQQATNKPKHNNNNNGKAKPKHTGYSTNAGYKQSTKETLPGAGLYAQHYVDLAAIIKHNSEIRRFTSLGVLNYLEQKGFILKSKNRYVNFQWDRFVVKVDHLRKEYAYTEPFFLNALAASFASFSSVAQRTMDTFLAIEADKRLEDVITNDEIAAFYDANEQIAK